MTEVFVHKFAQPFITRPSVSFSYSPLKLLWVLLAAMIRQWEISGEKLLSKRSIIIRIFILTPRTLSVTTTPYNYYQHVRSISILIRGESESPPHRAGFSLSISYQWGLEWNHRRCKQKSTTPIAVKGNGAYFAALNRCICCPISWPRILLLQRPLIIIFRSASSSFLSLVFDHHGHVLFSSVFLNFPLDPQ